ncbi:unnamed protein product [Spodoptera exigua]|nr:unnamed protein product [Spodoptera exigua]
MDDLRAIKYNVRIRNEKDDELNRINLQNLNNMIYKIKKLDKDSLRKELIKQVRQQRNHIKTVLYDTDASIDKLRTQVEEILQRIESWMEKYDKDMEAIDLNIQIKKNEYQNMRDKRVHLEETVTMIVFWWWLLCNITYTLQLSSSVHREGMNINRLQSGLRQIGYSPLIIEIICIYTTSQSINHVVE